MLISLLGRIRAGGRLRLVAGLMIITGLVFAAGALRAQYGEASAYAQKKSSCSQPASAPACTEGQTPSTDNCMCNLPMKCNYQCKCVTPCVPTSTNPCPH